MGQEQQARERQPRRMHQTESQYADQKGETNRYLRGRPKRSDWGLKGFRKVRQRMMERRRWRQEPQHWMQPLRQQKEREVMIP
jgi:hypothetical protein